MKRRKWFLSSDQISNEKRKNSKRKKQKLVIEPSRSYENEEIFPIISKLKVKRPQKKKKLLIEEIHHSTSKLA